MLPLLDIVGLLVILPLAVELVDLAGDVALLLQVEALVDLAEATLADQVQQQIAVVQDRVVLKPGNMHMVVSQTYQGGQSNSQHRHT